MKTIGLIGGLGPEATVDYYQKIIEAFKDKLKGSFNFPEIIVYSVNMEALISRIRANDHTSAINYLTGKLQSLEQAGADFIAITSNTPHLYYNDLKDLVNVPLLSIVEAMAREASRLGLKRPGLIGTAFTMNASFYSDEFAKIGIAIQIPDHDDREYINQKLFSEIEHGIFKEETRNGILEILEKMKSKQSIDGIILGRTEFPLILTEDQYHGLPVINTTRIHVDEIVKACRG